MDSVESYIKNRDYKSAINSLCRNNMYSLSKIISDSLNIHFNNNIKVKIYCNWTTTENITKIWSKMSRNGRWKNITLTTENDSDYNVIINCPNVDLPLSELKKSILFQMEPNMKNNVDLWKEWANPNPCKFFKVLTHDVSFNNIEWHLSKTYYELLNERVEKDPKLYNNLSTVLSTKYNDPGQIKRIDFIKYLDKNSSITVDVFGSNSEYKNYKGSLPYHCKDNAMFPYKYTFNVENNSIPNYFTEKLVDGILSESLVFYNGCPNVKNYINEKVFVWLDLVDFEHDKKIIEQAIKEDWYTQRLPYIKKAKIFILNEYQFFPRIYKLINT